MKNILASKTFWFNLLGGAVSVAQIIPPKYSIPTLAIANIGLRLITNQPITILPKE